MTMIDEYHNDSDGLFLLFFIFIFTFSVTQHISQSTTNQIHKAQSHSCSTDDTTSPKLPHQRRSSTTGQQKIDPRPCGSSSSTVDLVSLQVCITAKKKCRREKHR